MMDTAKIKRMVYKYLIDSHPLVSREYAHALDAGRLGAHDTDKIKEIAELNWKYRICRRGADTDMGRLVLPESSVTKHLSVQQMTDRLLRFDVVSFDIFDTLVFRAVEKPQDVFRLLEAFWNIIGFAKIREQAEQRARKIKEEITIDDIYHILAKETGIDPQQGVRMELQMEKQVCSANPYMMAVYQKLIKKGKKVIAVSDMYIQQERMKALLESCGYQHLFGIFVSCDHGCGKKDGALQKVVQKACGKEHSYVHIGDNVRCDIAGSKKAGWKVYHYPNIRAEGYLYRRREMTSLAAAFYKGLVNSKMHAGQKKADGCYEYGYVYGGVMAYGFCQYLSRLVKNENIGLLLFLARDGYMLNKIYTEFFPGAACAYVPFSRFAAYQLTMERNWRNFLQCAVRPRMYAVPKESLSQVIEICDIGCIRPYLKAYGLKETMLFDRAVYEKIEKLFEQQHAAAGSYSGQEEAAEAYFKSIIGGHKKICAVDIGWRGTSAACLKYFLEEKCGMDVCVCGALMGANGGGPSEIGLDTGRLHSYLFSPRKNADMLKRHTKRLQELDFRNLLIEILFTEDKPTFLKFQKGPDGKTGFIYGPKEDNRRMILRIQQGIYDFARDFAEYAARFPDWLSISGREAYMPLHALAGAQKYCIKLLGSYEINENSGIFEKRVRPRTFRNIVMPGS